MKKALLFITGVWLFSCTFAQLTVQNGYTAQQLGNILSGPNINVTNPTISGAPVQYGTFSFNGPGFPLSSGILLTTGNIFDCPGPNNSGSTSTDNQMPGNPYLTALAGTSTYDAAVFSINFQVQSDMIEFRYLFASEEYLEFVNSGFNDVFAFYISGPGISGMENLACVPNTNVPVTINNINTESYWQYFHNNHDGNTNIEFDGYTSVLTAKKTGLIPCSTYTLTMMIADAGDGVYDAAVFLQANSLIQGNVSASTHTFSDNNTALEGCIDASFTFELDSAVGMDTYIPYGIGGTAVNGIDYEHIDSMLVIPAGQLSATIIIDALSDGINEGTEDIELYFSPSPCEPKDTVTLHISDYQSLQFTTIANDLSCFESGDGEVNFNITGGTPPFTVILTDTNTHISQTYTSLPITGLSEGTYHIRILDGYGCYAEDIIAGGVFDAGTTFLPDGNGVSFTSSINISGFTSGQTLQDINQLQSVCMNMEHSFMGDLLIELLAPNGTVIELKPQPGGSKTNLGEPVATGSNDTHSEIITPGIGYDYCFNSHPTYGTMVSEANNYHYTYTSQDGSTQTDSYLPSGSYTSAEPLTNLIGVPVNGTWTLRITDEIPNNNGYIFNWSISLAADEPDSIVTLTQPVMPVISGVQTNPACGNNNGSINITVSGGIQPFTYHWSNGATTEDLSALAAGNYTVTVTDSTGCQYMKTFSLPNSSAAQISAVITHQQCAGTGSGKINISLTGGTAPFGFLWSNGASTEDIANLFPGTYNVQVTDQTGCISAATFTVQAVPALHLNSAVTDESCGDREGAINITAEGGTPPLFYSWSNNVYTEDLTDLQQGNYTVTVVDNYDCELIASFYVNNLVGNCIPDCDLNITQADVSPEICGNANGSITLDLYTTHLPYVLTWSNGSHLQNLAGLTAGIYTLTVTDNSGCSVIQNYTIQNQSGTLVLPAPSLINETCGNGNGGINISPAGGAQPYTYQWSTGATTQDLTNLSAGIYSVTLTDANLCKLIQTYTLQNSTGNLTQTYGNAMNAACGQNNGSVDITISGGNPPYSYAWSNNTTNEDLLNAGPGSYWCEITDAVGCHLNTPVYQILNESGSLSFDYIDADNEICGNANGEIQIAVHGGNPPYTFHWSTGSSAQNLTNAAAGNYACTVTDHSGCSLLTGNIEILNEPGSLMLADLTSYNEACGNGLGSVQLTLSGGAIPYTYHWNTGSVSKDLYGLSAGSYSCTVSDVNGCSFVVQAEVGNDAGSLQISNLVTSPEICGDSSGSINLVIHGGALPMGYLWDNGATTEDLNGLSAGNYNVTVTDARGCHAMASAAITNETGSLAVSILSVTNEVCNNHNGSIDLFISGGNPPYQYVWTNGGLQEDLSGIPAGTYSCRITDSNGCTVNTGDILIHNSAGTLSITSAVITEAVCTNANGTINITTSGGSGPLSYHWSNGALTEDLSGLSAGIYSITVTDQNACTLNQSFSVPYSSGPVDISNILITDETCGNGAGAIDLTLSNSEAPYTYHWNTGQVTQDLNSLSAGSYSVTITDINGCSTSQGGIVVSNNAGNFNLVSLSASPEVCGDHSGSINVTLSGGINPISYLWNNGAFTQDLSALAAGVYSCTATDQNGCILSFTSVITNDPGNLTANAQISNGNCAQHSGSIDLMVYGGTQPYAYLWSNGQTTQDLLNIQSGTYIVNITDAGGCMLYAEYVIPSVSPIYLTSTVISDEVCSNHQGSIQLSVSGGTGNYSYAWSPVAGNTNTLTGLSEGIYSVTITDLNGCTLAESFTVSGSHGTLEIAGAAITHDTCANGTGGIDLTLSGGNPPFSYYWNTGTVSPDLTGIFGGTYSITVTDVNGCHVTETYTVQSISGDMTFSAPVTTDAYCGDSSGSINISVSGGIPPYQYLWSNGSATEDLDQIPGGTYTVTVTDAVNCKDIRQYTLQNLTNGLTVTGTTTNEICNNGSGSIDLTISGGVLPYVIHWNTGESFEDQDSLSAGTYSYTVTDSTGCLTSGSFEIQNLPGDLHISNAQVTDENCHLSNGAINLSLAGGTAPITYHWSNAATTQDLSGLQQGNYGVTITDANGCELMHSYTIGFYYSFMITNAAVDGASCALCPDGSVNLTITGNGGPPYAMVYQWSNGSHNEDLTGVVPGTYTVTASDGYGCEQVSSYIVPNDSTGGLNPGHIQAFELYPNPASSLLTISWGLSGKDYLQIEIFNLLGKKLRDVTLDATLEGSARMDIRSLSDGIYLIRLSTGSEYAIRQLVIRK